MGTDFVAFSTRGRTRAAGRLDAVVANAGSTVPGDFATGDPGQWRDMALTNVYGVALTVKASLPHVLDTKGSVMLVGSVAGTRMVPGSLYGATKAAVHAMGENLRARLVGTGVHVSVIRPGRVEAPFWESAPDIALESADIAAAVLWILERPAGADVNELRMRPIGQER
jgi:NADP-dependent 3-hydroxy acid dehydrogenase YdfG